MAEYNQVKHDKIITRAIVLAAETIQLRVLDHLIISAQEVFSFRKEDLLWTIAAGIKKHYPDLNNAQRKIVGHADGPLLVIAGPGSGKNLQHRFTSVKPSAFRESES